MVCFLIARSGQVQRDDTRQKRALTELGFTWRAQTWSVGIFFQARKNGMVYFLIVPSVRVGHLVTKTQKCALTELGSF